LNKSEHKFCVPGPIRDVGCSTMQHLFASEAMMAHYVDRRPPEPVWTTHWQERLPLGVSLFVIAGCSALSWALLVAIGTALLRFAAS
jgi:hypothetical protein